GCSAVFAALGYMDSVGRPQAARPPPGGHGRGKDPPSQKPKDDKAPARRRPRRRPAGAFRLSSLSPADF
ncbi:MAG: hypothetical protein PT951_02685, partial [Eubacteriales bacterium]|nr:hypothetical protein [Eubacteriales bacterium]